MQGYALFIALTAAIGGLLFGYEVGIINQVLLMDSFRLYFGLSSRQGDTLVNTPESPDLEGNIVSLFLAGCIPGAFLVSYSSELLGRRMSVALGTVWFLIGAILQCAATSIGLLYAGRIVGGLGVGLLSGTVPLYISECAPTSIRGRIGTMQQLMITIGIMVANIMNAILTSVISNDKDSLWRVAFGIQLIPAIILLGCFFILPESPRFLMSKGKIDQAITIIARVNGEPKESELVQQVVTEIQESIAIEKRLPQASWLDMIKMPIRPRSVAAFGVFFFQQWSGINAVMYYSSSLFLGMGLSKDIATKVATTVQSVINVLSTFPAVYLIEKIGRRRLLFIGAVGCSFFMWSLVLWVGLFNGTQILDPGTKTLIPNPDNTTGKAYSILGVLSMYMYIVFFAATWGPVGWVYIAEIFPLRARGKGASVGSMSHWIWNFVIAKVWPYAASSLGAWQYTVFGGSTLIALGFVYMAVPETMGKSLEEMDEVFGGAPGSGLTDEEKRILAELRADPTRASLLETGKTGKNPNKAAYIMARTDEVVTYGMLDERSNRTAQMFRHHGLQAGDGIIIFMENHPRYFEIVWGAQRSGLRTSAISSKLLVDEVQFAKEVAKIHSDKNIQWFLVDGKEGVFKNYIDERAKFPAERIKDEIAGGTMLYTSGSTGRPKGVQRILPEIAPEVLAQLMKFDNEHPIVAIGKEYYGWDENSVYLSPAPLYHAAPLHYNLAIGSLGGTSIILDRFDPEFALHCIQKYKCTTGQLVPTHFVRWLKLPEQVRKRYDLSSLKLIFHAAAPCPIPVKQAMIEWIGPKLMEYYAGTESNGSTIITSEEWLQKKGSVGRVRTPGVEIKICNENGDVLPPKQEGLVYFAGGGQFEYHGDAKKTSESRHPKNPGWSTLGDVGWVDEDGFMIISGGVNIYPQEIENLLITHPKVQDAAVIGAPDEEMGEKVIAVVQPLDWSTASQELADEIASFLRERLSHVKVPKKIEFMRDLPRHDTGKLYKRLIRDAYWGKGSPEYLGVVPKKNSKL
ncbi:hypothetical protein HDU93_007021 [Gonapodya sp. JEL0774]|nr:hypothetical protein HDU93_007021 [Gonapodya sp. JEL0774]